MQNSTSVNTYNINDTHNEFYIQMRNFNWSMFFRSLFWSS